MRGGLSMAKLSIDIPDAVVSQMQLSGDTLETVILKALEEYLGHQFSHTSEVADITQTQTWQLCGRLSLAEPSLEEMPDAADSKGMTNYAEQVDDVLYQGT